MRINTIHNIDCRTGLQQLEKESIHCCVTSPPYYGLRDYGTEAQLGLEKTPDEYIKKMVEVFREVKRVLKKDGTLWLNIGDSYARNGGEQGGGNRELMHMDGKQKRMGKVVGGLKEKDLIGIPWMLAFALRADGWYLRQDIIWHKPNPMPESITDRCTKAHEYIFLLSKSQKYYFDQAAILQDIAPSGLKDKRYGKEDYTTGRPERGFVGSPSHGSGLLKRKSGNIERKNGSERGCHENTGANVCGSVPWEGEKANKRSVWTVSTKPYSGAHFAVFPQDLIIDCIKAGCPENGVVLDPFMGAGTTAMVANKANRNFIGFELNPEYCKMANQRLYNELGMFSKAHAN